MQPRDLVFVLVGEKLVIAFGHGKAQVLGHPGHQRAETVGIGGVLVVGQAGGKPVDLFLFCQGRCRRFFNQLLKLLRMQDNPAPDLEGAQVALHRRAVQGDRLTDRIGRERDMALLPGGPQKQHVGKDRIPHQLAGDLGRIDEADAILQPRLKRDAQGIGRQVKIPVAGEGAGDDLMAVDHRAGAPRRHQAQRPGAAADDEVTADQTVRLTHRDADRADILGPVRQPQVDMDGAALLGEARHLHHARTLAVDLRRLRHHRADGDDTGAADPGDDDVEGAVDRGQHRLGQVRQVKLRRRGLFHRRPFQRHEGRAEPVEAGEILVAGRLVDGALAAELRLNRNDGDTVRLHPAIAAALADLGVDEDPLVRVGELPALAAAPLFGGAGLDIKNDRHTLDFGAFLLHQRHLVPFVECKPCRELRAVELFLLVIHDEDVPDPHRRHFPRNAPGGQPAFVRLAAGHGDGVVEEDLVGDRRARGEGSADRQAARMVIGPVAEVLEHMAARGKRRLADPVRALAAHLGEAERGAVHPLHHVVTADPGIGAAALGDLGRGVVRAAGAVIGQPRRDLGRVVGAAGFGDGGEAGLHLIGAAPLLDQDAAQLFGDIGRV